MTTKVDNIIKAFANDLEGFTREECLKEDFSARQCEVLENVLGTKHNCGDGAVTPEEKTALEQAGFAKDFIQDLAGTNGNKALQVRVRWLGDHVGTKWYRKDYSPKERQDMAFEFQKISRNVDAKEAVPGFIDALDDEDAEVRYWVADALGIIGPDAKDAVPALIALLKDQAENMRFIAAWALGQISPDTKDAVPYLIDVLKDKDQRVRAQAARSLGEIGKKAFFAIPALQKMAVTSLDPDCQRAAQEALDKMMGEIR